MNPTQLIMMVFMAGMGAKDFAKFVAETTGAKTSGKHATGREAQANPAMTTSDPRTAQLIAQLAQMRGGLPGAQAGGMNPLAALQGR